MTAMLGKINKKKDSLNSNNFNNEKDFFDIEDEILKKNKESLNLR